MYCLLTLAPKCHNSAYPKLIDVSSPLCLAHLSLALTKKTSSTRQRAKQLTKWRWICWVESNNLLICSSSISPAPSREYYDFYPVSFPSGVCNLICIFTLPTPSPSPSLSPPLSPSLPYRGNGGDVTPTLASHWPAGDRLLRCIVWSRWRNWVAISFNEQGDLSICGRRYNPYKLSHFCLAPTPSLLEHTIWGPILKTNRPVEKVETHVLVSFASILTSLSVTIIAHNACVVSQSFLTPYFSLLSSSDIGWQRIFFNQIFGIS